MSDPAAPPRFVLMKRGLYYRPDNCGYTGILARAGRYHADEADPESGVTAIHEDDAPMFAPACWEDVKLSWLSGLLTEEQAKVAAYRAALTASVDTKVAYIGEIKFTTVEVDEFGDERTVHRTLEWTTTKDVMAMILAHADAAIAQQAKAAEALA